MVRAHAVKDIQKPKSGLRRVGVFLALFLALVSLSFVAFRLKMPPTGYIDIRYDGNAESGLFWELDNRSTQSIYMEGKGDKVWGGSAAITKCTKFDYSSEESDPPYFADGSPSIIKVSPGERYRLYVETSLPKKYKGGRCRIRLSLLGGTFVESQEFIPK
jgi:hypothetical protein